MKKGATKKARNKEREGQVKGDIGLIKKQKQRAEALCDLTSL